MYEPVINPSAYLIKSVGVGSTAIYVDNLRPIFNSQNENDTDLTFQKKVKFVRQETKTECASLQLFRIRYYSSVTISDGGVIIQLLQVLVQLLVLGQPPEHLVMLPLVLEEQSQVLLLQVQVLDTLIQIHLRFLFHLQLILKKK